MEGLLNEQQKHMEGVQQQHPTMSDSGLTGKQMSICPKRGQGEKQGETNTERERERNRGRDKKRNKGKERRREGGKERKKKLLHHTTQ